jgi:hypothetical protein
MTEAHKMMLLAGAVLLIFVAIGGLMIYSALKSRSLAKASQRWPTAGGKILASEVKSRTTIHRRSRTTVFVPEISYGYRVAGRDYRGSVVRFGNLERATSGLAQELVAKYRQGAMVVVRYDPANPDRATLETSASSWRQVASGVFFIAVALFIFAIFSVVYKFGDAASSPPPDRLDQIDRPT